MSDQELFHLRFPIGKFLAPDHVSRQIKSAWINDISQLPTLLREHTEHLSEIQLQTPYRMGGWNIRQVVNHLADSHINAYTRIKLALTENSPIIKTYEENIWAELEDGKKAPILLSLNLLDALHARWTILLKSLDDDDLQKNFFHPVSQHYVSVEQAIGTYSWHGRHHLAHITELKKRKAWN